MYKHGWAADSQLSKHPLPRALQQGQHASAGMEAPVHAVREQRTESYLIRWAPLLPCKQVVQQATQQLSEDRLGLVTCGEGSLLLRKQTNTHTHTHTHTL